MQTGLVWDERYLWHLPGGGAGPLAHTQGMIEPGDFGEEGPHPRRRLRNLIEVSGLLDMMTLVKPRAATRDELTRVHTADYVERVRALSASGGGDAGGGTPFGPNGYAVATLAAGGVLRAAELVTDGTLENAYALVKPPGHHAPPDAGNGHCIFNNAALAAAHLLATTDTARVSIVDWDVHWGNGTQAAFWADGRVQVISLHQADWYPRGGGRADEVGEASGRGATINIPLPPGSGIGAYTAAFERVVLPAIAQHAPDFIVVSCGFDASANDPSGRMLLTSADFRQLARWVLQAGRVHCSGRVLFCHEGGYSPTYVPFCGVAVIEELCGADQQVVDPFLERYSGVGYEALQPHQEQALTDVLSHHPHLRA